MTDEQAALLNKARDSIRGATLLADAQLCGFAVSRAYYAMFYVAEALLLGEELSFSKHSAVIAAFGERFAKTGRVPAKLHQYLIEGQDRRNVGDYGIGPALDREEAATEISRAREFLDLAVGLLGSPPSGD